ncbi:outer membrane beta-barrel protein [Hymenobacter sp. BT770]|uniref:outer membrane beta-barrel protein n=1 Tax=Hymenobacter sp. BT770 TaxID=2886942 RepID=UPI001D1133C6|nr:outer membrane beta-barrel protein [Hymenobacter sp. BT770]MCC3151982.1 porin family protein [Hymenobacter sp. BT770]MDO3417092.1 outer membrane beta-barrel protein [Hymenobacter sp. BT770]
MPTSRFAFCGLLLSVSLMGRAQNADLEPKPAYRLYGDLAAYSSYFLPLGNHSGTGFGLPLQATLGYQLRPRLAVQVGVAYRAASGNSEGTILYNGSSRAYANDYRNTNLSVSVLGRYTLTRNPAHRLQFDVLGGMTLERHTFRGTGFYPDYDQPTGSVEFDRSSSNNRYLLTAGASVRYQLSPRFELLYTSTVNTDIRSFQQLTTSSALGLRYHFGRR